MRKVVGCFLVALGVFGIALAVLLPTVVVDRTKKTPLDLNIKQLATGPAKLFDAASGEVRDVKLRALRRVLTDSTASDGDNTTVNASVCVAVDDGNLPKDKCPTNGDPRLLTVSFDRVTADRVSGESVHVAAYDEAVNGDTDVRHKGLSYKFPIDTEKKDYQLFFADVRKAFPAKYQGTDTIKGFEVYKFVSSTGRQPYTIKGTFPGFYEDTRTVWVEPTTGAIIKGIETQKQTLADQDGQPGQVALDTTLTFAQESIDFQANYAQTKIDDLKLAQVWGPIIAGIVGVAALVGAFFLLRTRDRGDSGGHRRGAAPPPDTDPENASDDASDDSSDSGTPWYADGGSSREDAPART